MPGNGVLNSARNRRIRSVSCSVIEVKWRASNKSSAEVKGYCAIKAILRASSSLWRLHSTGVAPSMKRCFTAPTCRRICVINWSRSNDDAEEAGLIDVAEQSMILLGLIAVHSDCSKAEPRFLGT